MRTTQIITENPFKDANQPTQFPNAVGINLPNVDEISVADLNRTMLQPNPSARIDVGADAESEPLFGTHLREAATTVKKLFGS